MKRLAVLVVLFASLAMFGCAGVQSFDSQLAGVQKAIATLNKLAQASPLDPATKAQLANWEAWENLILGGVGAVKEAVNPTVAP